MPYGGLVLECHAPLLTWTLHNLLTPTGQGMFSSSGLFQDTPCPQGKNCSLLKCIFSHGSLEPKASHELSSLAQNGATINEPTEHVAKKRRIDRPEPSLQELPQDKEQKPEAAVTKSPSNPEGLIESNGRAQPRTSDHGSIALKGVRDGTKLWSAARAISPPVIHSAKVEKKRLDPKQVGKQSPAPNKPEVQKTQKPKEQLNPRVVQPSPASHPVRLAILQQLHKAMMNQNENASKDPKRKSVLTLSSDEVIAIALDEEERIARDNPTIYSNVIKQRVMKVRKMTSDEWQSTVRTRLTPQPTNKAHDESPKPEQSPSKLIASGLTAREELQVLRKLQTPLTGLESHGYVTKPPSDAEIESARSGVMAADGFERCERCNTRFQVFPGRREDGLLATGGACTYHWAKLQRPQWSRTDAITGSKEAIYPCCKESVGISSGCTTSPTHVFKVSEAKRLASVLQFERTPDKTADGRAKKVRGAVTFDCEMGFTTMGMELIRLTAVAWPLGQELLDVLVRPIGEVLDLNTRFSGVTPEQITNAIPYGQQKPPAVRVAQEESPDNTSEDGELQPEKPQPLKIASSPAAARQLLFDILSPETPLIGHAIDNDLNAARIIHPFIVDTVLLFPHPRKLPIRYSLKMLASKYLERHIQTSGAQGHDSKEDALATGDLVRVKVAEKWKQLHIQGWTFEDGILTEPENGTTVTSGPSGLAGQKRGLDQVDGAETG